METSIILSVVGFIVGLAVLWGITQYELKELKLRCNTMELWISMLRDSVMEQTKINDKTATTIEEIAKCVAKLYRKEQP